MEFVYVVPREALFPNCLPQGLLPFRGQAAFRAQRARDGREELLQTVLTESGQTASETIENGHLETADAFHTVVRTHGFFVERERAERTPAWKQIIPYTIVQVDGQVLLVQRKKAGGESRLHDKLSIGIGGHVEPVDQARSIELDELDPIAAGSRRELAEEIDIQGRLEIRSVGLLNDDSNPVGAVHLGLVQVAEVDGTVQVREEDILAGRMVAPGKLATLLREGANFESWSAILIERLQTLLPSPITTT